LKEIYANRKANVKKTEWYKTIDSGTGAMSTHSEVNRERHAFRRRILDHAFSDSAIRSTETFIIDNIRTWCEHLAEGAKAGEWTPEKNMSDWCTYIAYDIMGDLVFGKHFNMMENDEHRFVPAMMMSALEFIYPVSPATL
jgi:cytochrome P450